MAVLESNHSTLRGAGRDDRLALSQVTLHHHFFREDEMCISWFSHGRPGGIRSKSER